MTKSLLTGLLVFGQIIACAQAEYSAATIPSGLTENAHAVIRRQETTFVVKSAGEAVKRFRTVVTVLDEQGDEHASMTVPYYRLSKITDFTGALYEANGRLIKRLRKGDIADYSSYADYNLYDDQRQKTAQFPKQPTYPYTVEFIVETSEQNLMFYPVWMPQSDEHLAVEQATFRITMPAGLPLRYKEMNVPRPGVASPSAEGGKTFFWQIDNRPVITREPVSPPLRQLVPVVYTAPTTFQVQAYQGNLSSWADLSRFYNTLNEGRDQIPDDLRQRMVELTKNETTQAGKIRKVYQYLQEHTRYVSVQLGMGGWQTIDASNVAISRYGDCKALTNFAKALLKTVGIVAYPALVRAGSREPDALTDFPSFQFNHVILCVPNGRDTTFLECTSEFDPAGYLGDFTGNRHALLILPDGGRLIRTPAYAPTSNRQQRHITVRVSEQGDAIASVRTRYTGLQQEDYGPMLHGMNRDDQRSWLLKRIQIPAFELSTFAHEKETGPLPAVREKLGLSVRRWANVSGTRLFLPLNLMSSLAPVTAPAQPRQTPVELDTNYDFEDSDTIAYELPAGFQPEYLLEPLLIESPFGRYLAQATVKNDRLLYIRHVSMHSGRFPASAYKEWVDFRRKIAKADRVQMVFVRKN